MDNIADPAEHQIAVECLVVISRIDERNPELKLNGAAINLIALINEAIHKFWNNWISDKANQNVLSNHCNGTSMVRNPFSRRPSKDFLKPPVSPTSSTSPTSVSPVDNKELKLRSNSTNLDFSFKKNERLARKLFFDLRQDGSPGTMSFLAEACVRHAFGVNWSSEKIGNLITGEE